MSKHTPTRKINGTELLRRLIEREEERNENGQFVVINHSLNGSSTKYIRYDAMVFELNEMLKENKAFAAAPELLEALKEIVKENEFRGYGDSLDSIKAKEAIKKATL